MGYFSYFDIFATKGLDYLIAIICVLALIVFWMWLQKSDQSPTESAGWVSSIVGIVVVVAVLSVIVLAYHVGISSPEAKTMNAGLETLPIYGFDLSAVPDGTFRGESSFGSFTCKVDVTIKNHKIKTIEIVDDEKGLDSPEGREVIRSVLDEQTPYVSAISGATISTKTFLRALENALLSAL